MIQPYDVYEVNETELLSYSFLPNRENRKMTLTRSVSSRQSMDDLPLALAVSVRSLIAKFEGIGDGDYCSALRRILGYQSTSLARIPDRLSASTRAVLDFLGRHFAAPIESGHARLHRIFRALQFITGRSHPWEPPTRTAATVPSIRRVKAFFVSQKVSARNAP